MSYTVLARKYRSRTFAELVGQDAIATTLANAIQSGRVHHGYLFCGTRGVGKTSLARILAKSLNCSASDGPTVSPCCECESCRLISEGQDIDVIEIDAASNTGVDNIRELISNSAYRPARSRYKVYIVDEVHMLSTGAFNALLKTLEEPPEHVKFVFATTEVQKVPLTIRSRCQRFDFRSIDPSTIARQLQNVLQGEGVKADEAVLRRVARLANGSMRDGLSLLDQLLSGGAKELTAERVDELLPAAHDEMMVRLVESLAGRDAAGALGVADEVLSGGHTVERLCESLIQHFRSLMLLRICGPDSELVDVPAAAREEVNRQAQRFDEATYVYFISLLEQLRRNVKFSGSGRALLDAAIVRMAHSAAFSSLQSILDALGDNASEGAKKKVTATPGVEPDRTGRVVEQTQGAGGESTIPAPAERTSPAGSPSRPSAASANGQSDRGAPKPETSRFSGKVAAIATPRPQAAANGPSAAGSRNVPASKVNREAVSHPLVQLALQLFDGAVVLVENQPTAAAPVAGGTDDHERALVDEPVNE